MLGRYHNRTIPSTIEESTTNSGDERCMFMVWCLSILFVSCGVVCVVLRPFPVPLVRPFFLQHRRSFSNFRWGSGVSGTTVDRRKARGLPPVVSQNYNTQQQKSTHFHYLVIHLPLPFLRSGRTKTHPP